MFGQPFEKTYSHASFSVVGDKGCNACSPPPHSTTLLVHSEQVAGVDSGLPPRQTPWRGTEGLDWPGG